MASDSNDHEKLLSASEQQSQRPDIESGAAEQRRAQLLRQRRIERVVQYIFASIFLLLVLIVTTYAVSNTLIGCGDPIAEQQNNARLTDYNGLDCRTTGCNKNFECALLDAEFECINPPCKKSIYQCVPAAIFEDTDEIASIQAAPPMIKRDTPVQSASPQDDMSSLAAIDEFEDDIPPALAKCIKNHDGRSIWRVEGDPCNTCRCTDSGRVTCTRKLCNPDNLVFESLMSKADSKESTASLLQAASASASAAEKAAPVVEVPELKGPDRVNRAAHTWTNIMVPVVTLADEEGELSTLFTSIAVEI
ncbi:hypothetical protein FBU59_001260 [Linderina macrospora]|uniref:Uncharacterized protein n=1 Tax=Linderina macrospora TaxID=4868 RepID=A0ACC1JEC3_9FUNG|nr:hypothetical protein FBU59_001260 [Linderina macrospora]